MGESGFFKNWEVTFRAIASPGETVPNRLPGGGLFQRCPWPQATTLIAKETVPFWCRFI
jgi:hypothetical protein